MEIVKEADYRCAMETEAASFLKECRYSGYFDPDGKGNIYYERYMHKQISGIIVMIHGFTESAEKYAELIYYFVKAGYGVYIPDMRGHGRSVRETGDLSLVHIDDYGRYIEDIRYLTEKIAKKENPDKPVFLYGHSMGGGIGAAVLEKQPDLFKKAVLSSPMIRPSTGSIPFVLARRIAGIQVRLGNGKKYVAGQHEFRADETFENSAATSKERYHYYYEKKLLEKRFQTNGASYAWLKEAAGLSGYVLKKENCRRIRAEILMFQAGQDDYVDCKAQKRFAKRVKDIRLITMPGTKHEIYMSDDDTMSAYLEHIFAFLCGGR